MAITARFVSGHGPAKSLGLITLLNAVAAFPAYGAITTTGSVTPADPALWPTSTLQVGPSAYGSLVVNDGSDVTSAAGSIGANSTGSGDVDVTGTGSSWTNTGTLSIGNGGLSTLDIMDGGIVSNTSGAIGGGTVAAVGMVTVNNGTWTNSSTLSIGSAGNGTLNILNGGSVTSSGTTNVNATAKIDIDGLGSSWTNTGNVRVGGVTEITGGGALTATGSYIVARTAGVTTTVTVSGTDAGSGTRSKLNTGGMTLGDAGIAILDVEAGAEMTTAGATIGSGLGSTGTLIIDGVGSKWTNNVSQIFVGSSGTGTLTVTNGGTLTSATNLNVGAAGTVNLQGGTMDLGGKLILTNATATFNFTGGTLKHVASYGSSLLQTGGTLAAGTSTADTTGTMSITGDYTLGTLGTLEVELAGLAHADFDRYSVGEDAVLAGLLDVSLLGGFAPEEGQVFDVLTADTIDATLLTLAQPSSYSYEIINGAGTQTLRVTVIPEPATFALIAMGLGCIASRRRGGVLAGR